MARKRIVETKRPLFEPEDVIGSGFGRAMQIDGAKIRYVHLRTLQMGKNDSLNSRTLSRALKQLAKVGFADRRILDTQPFAVEYSLTRQGRGLWKLLQAYSDLDPRSKG